MDEHNSIAEERQAIIDAMADEKVSSEEYQKMLSAVETLTRIQKTETETEVAREKAERETNLAESRAKAELRVREEEVLVKKRDSRRQVLKVILGGLFGIGQICLIANYEETKALVGKAWGFITKPKL